MKFKFIILFLSLFLLACDSNEQSSNQTNLIETTNPPINEIAYIYLNYPDEQITIETKIGDYIIIPEYIKDDYIFIGWTDGVNHYAGKTLINQNNLVLTPDFITFDQAFEYIQVTMGQAYLRNYLGDYHIIGIPQYWNGLKIVGFDYMQGVQKLFSPVSTNLSTNLYSEITDYGFYGLEYFYQFIEIGSYGPIQGLDNDCLYDDGSPIDFMNPVSGFLNDACPIKAIIREEDYRFAVMKISISEYPLILPYQLTQQLNLQYLSLNHYNEQQISAIENNHLLYLLEHINYESDQFKMIDNMIFRNIDNEFYVSAIHTNDEILQIDASEYKIYPRSFHTDQQVQSIIINNPTNVYASEGILYGKTGSDSEYIYLLFYPYAKEDPTYVFPDKLISITFSKGMTNPYVQSITLNNEYIRLYDILSVFPNLKEIIVPDNHPNYLEENGIIYNKEMTSILFVNDSVKDLVVKNSVSIIFNGDRLNHLDSIYFDKNINENTINILSSISQLGTIIIDDENPMFMAENNIVYNKDKTEILFVDKNIDNLVIDAGVERIHRSALSYNLRVDNQVIRSQIQSLHINSLIDARSFTTCLNDIPKLENISIDENNPNMVLIDNILYTSDLTRILFVNADANLQSLHIGKDINSINFQYNMNHLSSITLVPENPYYSLDHGILLNKEATEVVFIPPQLNINEIVYDSSNQKILYIPENLDISHYIMPEASINPFEVHHSHEYSLNNLDISSIYIGENYVFNDDFSDEISKHMDKFNQIDINNQSPFYDLSSHSIISLEKDTLFFVFGTHKDYILPSNITKIHPNSFDHMALENLVIDTDYFNLLPSQVFALDTLKSITIKGQFILNSDAFIKNYIINEIGPTYDYYFASTDLIIYVEESMLETYQNHPFWSLYDIRVIE